MKTCTRCKIYKESEKFSKDSKRVDGLQPNCKECSRAWYLKNRTKILQKAFENKDFLSKRKLEYQTRRRKEDPAFRLAQNLRNRLNKVLKGRLKAGSAIRELGCSPSELKTHIENQFKPGMDWKNHGDWHVDHIKPLSKFDLTDLSELREACHYSNLQPLWAKENLEKRDR